MVVLSRMGNSQGKPVCFTDQVNLNHFRLLRVVGKGAFGKVRIVERKDTGLTFALKYIRKEEVVRSESVRNIIRERRMLEHLDHPFLCNLRYSFQDIEYIYIVVDLMNGGDLRFHISRKCFTEEAVRFWIAELGCALRYIHSQGIVHRDVKPDNVLLDEDGHVHLADFNVASDFRPGKLLTSKSGTLAYLAPEVYAGHGYLSEVDWWSLGVTLYECIYSRRPFEGRSQDTLSEGIQKAQPKYYVTNPAVSVPCLRAMAALMEKDRSKRIGAISWESFTTHPFFAELDFEALERKEVLPIFKPASDKTNFDATYDLEELLLEEAPLEARARRQKPRATLREDATAKEIREDELHRLIETMFEPFDYTTVGYRGNAAEAVAAVESAENGLPPAAAIPTPATHARQVSQTARSNGSPPPQHDNPINRMNEPEPVASLDESLAHQDLPPHAPAPPSSPPPPIPSFHKPLTSRPHVSGRKPSKGGGVQMVLEETGSWSELADHNVTTLSGDGYDSLSGRKNRGMFGFLRSKGRDRSPKPTEPGVLGKEGTRQIIN